MWVWGGEGVVVCLCGRGRGGMGGRMAWGVFVCGFTRGQCLWGYLGVVGGGR